MGLITFRLLAGMREKYGDYMRMIFPYSLLSEPACSSSPPNTKSRHPPNNAVPIYIYMCVCVYLYLYWYQIAEFNIGVLAYYEGEGEGITRRVTLIGLYR